MNSSSKRSLLTFEWDSKNEMIEIHGDEKGLKKLKEALDLLLAKSGNDHVHLMSNEWGGEELSSEVQGLDNELVNHVKIFKWDGTR